MLGLLALFITFLLQAPDAQAQPFSFMGFLDPEGSRLIPGSLVAPRHPGKPDPRWKGFDWKYIDFEADQTKVRLYFYHEEEWTARLALPQIQKEVAQLKEQFNYSPSQKFNYLLFATHRNFQQTNVFNISEGVQGVTATTEPTMAIPYWGEMETFAHISTHEMVHQFQTQKIADLSKAPAAMAASLIPLWFIEGMAEYYSLHGIDPETRSYLRDLLIHPDEKKNYKMPKLFEEGALGFVHIYKVGQAKIDFFETEFGKGTVQRLLEVSAKQMTSGSKTFAAVTTEELKLPADQLEERWQNYLNRHIRPDAERLTQGLDGFDHLKEAGDTLDHYELSPDGTLLLIREMDPLTGRTALYLLDLKNGNRRTRVAQDSEPGLLRLFFMQLPSIALRNDRVAYFVETTEGPELELKEVSRDRRDKLNLSKARRIRIHPYGITEALSPAFSPDGNRLAFVGLDPEGRQNVFILDLSNDGAKPPLRQLTREFYSWKFLSWNAREIIGASDRTPNRRTGVFAIDPENSAIRALAVSNVDLTMPEGNPDSFVFQSMESGSAQLHRFEQGVQTRLTDAKTALSLPRLRGNQLHFLALKGGRYGLFSSSQEKLKPQPAPAPPNKMSLLSDPPWFPRLQEMGQVQVQAYKAFSSSGVRLDNLSGFFGSGGVGGLTAQVSDLMRDYSVSGEFLILGGIRNTNFNLFISSQRGRINWTTGAYYTILPRADINFDGGNEVRYYLHREWGGILALQYPLGAFSFIDAEMRVGGVTRTDYSDSRYNTAFESINPGHEPHISPVFRFGYDRVLYELFTGPLKGWGLLLESDTSIFPRRQAAAQRLRLDAAYYAQIAGPTVLALQGIAGVTWGSQFRNPFYVSSDDLFRAYNFADIRLLGNYLLGVKTELRFPIGTLFNFPPFRGMIGADLGTVYSFPGQAYSRVTSSYSGGLAFNFPPIAVNFIVSKPVRVAPGPIDSTVVHFTLRYLYL